MTESAIIAHKYDKGGRRLGLERRQYDYAMHLPERRAGDDRRTGDDRRDISGFKPWEDSERRGVFRGNEN